MSRGNRRKKTANVNRKLSESEHNPPPSPPKNSDVSNRSEEARLAAQIQLLQIEKLQSEIGEIRRSSSWRTWLVSQKLTDWLTPAVAAITALLAWQTGFFNATSERLRSETTLLTYQKQVLDQDKQKLLAERYLLEREIAPYRDDYDAAEELRQMADRGVYCRIQRDLNTDSATVSLSQGNDKVGYYGRICLDHSAIINDSVYSERLSKAVSLASKIKDIDTLDLFNFKIDGNQLTGVAPKITRIFLCDCYLNNRSLSCLPVDISCIEISSQAAAVLISGEVKRFPKLTQFGLTYSDVSIETVELLANAAPALEHLSLSNTNFDDSLVDAICKLKKIKSIDLRSTNVSGDGICELARRSPAVEFCVDEDIVRKFHDKVRQDSNNKKNLSSSTTMGVVWRAQFYLNSQTMLLIEDGK